MSLILFGALIAGAEEANDVAVRGQPIFSETRRFVVTGLPGADAMPIVRWAEDVADRIARNVGQPPPFDPGEPLVIRVYARDALSGPAIDATQGYFSGRLEQRLVFLRPGTMDQEDALEVLTALLLARYLVQTQPVSERSGDLILAPAWLSVGLAQNLFKESRARNLSIAADLCAEGSLPMAQGILALRTMPAGRWRDKYCASALVSWLLTRPESGPKLQGLLRRIAAQGAASDYVLAAWAGCKTYPEMDSAWQQWIARPREFAYGAKDAQTRAASVLDSFMEIEPASYGIRGTNVPDRVSMELLVERRGEPWAGSLAHAVGKRLDGATASLPPEAAPALAALREFYAALAITSKPHRMFGRAMSEADLRGLLDQVQRAASALKATASDRDRYLGAFDRIMAPESTSTPLPDPAVHDYLDRVEQGMVTP